MEHDDENHCDQDEREEDGEAVVHGGSVPSVTAPTAIRHPLLRAGLIIRSIRTSAASGLRTRMSANAIRLAIGRLLGRLRLRLLLLERIDLLGETRLLGLHLRERVAA
jgi:hypothetical protein